MTTSRTSRPAGRPRGLRRASLLAAAITVVLAIPVAVTAATLGDIANVNIPVTSDYELPPAVDVGATSTPAPTPTPTATAGSGTGVPRSTYMNRHALYSVNGKWVGYGQNAAYQLASTTTPVTSIIEATNLNNKNITKVAIGSSVNLGISTDGRLWSWGAPSTVQGVSPYNALMPQLVPGIPDATRFVSVSIGGRVPATGSGWLAAAAIDTDGSLWTWGQGGTTAATNSNMLGSSTELGWMTPRKIHSGAGFTQVALGQHSGAAIDRNGQVWTWGSNMLGGLADSSGLEVKRTTPSPVSGLRNIVQLSFTHETGHALDTSGVIYSWGRPTHGSLGTGSQISITPCGFTDAISRCPTKVQAAGVVFTQMSSGFMHTVALDNQGRVWVFGDNNFGQGGRGFEDAGDSQSMSPVQISKPSEVGKFTGVVALYYGSSAVDDQGRIYTWGSNSGINGTVSGVNSSQLGNKLTANCNQLTPMQPAQQTYPATCKVPK